MTRSERRPKERLHRNVWAASATSFLTDVSSEMILNVLPLFLANVLGVRVWAVGAVEGLADTTASILKLYSGWLSDRLRARKWLAVAGYALSAMAKPFYLLATSWTHIAAIRSGDRVGKGVRTAPRDALLADSTAAGRRGLAFGLHRAADTGGAVVGLLVTLWVVHRVQGAGALLGEETFRSLVVWSLLPAFAGVLLLATWARDVPVEDLRPHAPELAIRRLGRPFTMFVLASVVFEAGNSADAFLVLRAQERGLSVVDILWVLLGFNIVYALVATPAGALADRLSRRGVVATSWMLYALTYLGFAVAETGAQVTALYLVYGVYHGAVAGAAKALVADLVPAAQRGMAFGGYAAAIGLISLPASLMAGLLWEGIGSWSGFGPAAPFAFGAATATLATAVLLWAVPARPIQLMSEADAPTSPTGDVRVVAAVVEREGRFLLGRRPAGKRHAGLWEFPGGKIREGETVTTAARRELSEELSMHVVSVGRTLFVRRDGDAPYVIEFVEVEAEGTPESIEHDEVDWHVLDTMLALPLAPADAAFVAWLGERDREVPIRRHSRAP